MRKTSRIPNLRNLGINLRILIIANAAIALVALILSHNSTGFITLLSSLCTIAQPILLLSVLLLYGSYNLLSKMPYWLGVFSILMLVLLVCSGMFDIFSQLVLFGNLPSRGRILLFGFLLTTITLYYFNLQ